MEKVINSYETLFVVDCALGEEGVKAIVDKFTTLIGETEPLIVLMNGANADLHILSTTKTMVTMFS